MIQIQNARQFARAAERLTSEKIHVSCYEQNFYRVNNLTKDHAYYLRIERKDGKTFGHCTCEAGHPTKGRNRVPMVCKHLCAVVMLLQAVREMRRHVAH